MSLLHTIQQAPGSLVITDTDGHVLFANNAVTQRSGYVPTEIIGKQPGTLWGGEMSQDYYRALWDTITTQHAFVEEVVNTYREGTLEHYLHIAPIIDAHGQIAYYIEMQLPPTVAASPSKEAAYQSAFRTLFNGYQDEPAALVEWCGEQLGIGTDEISLLLRQAEEEPDMSSFLFHVLVGPQAGETPNRASDMECIHRAQTHLGEYRYVYDSYFQTIYAYFQHRVHTPQEAADLTQEVFARAMEKLGTFRPGQASYKTYLLRVAHNLLVNYYRDKKVAVDIQPFIDVLESAPVDTLLLRDELEQHMDTALTPIEREVIQLRYWKGHSVREIAQRIEKSENAVKLHLSRARKKLRDVVPMA